MADRRPIKKEHERAVVADFLAWLNARRGTRFAVIAEPDPPEAIIRSVRVTRWVEVANVFWTSEYAQDLYSYATPGEVHQPVPRGPYMDMDRKVARRFVQVLCDKLEKRTYRELLEKYGPGYLLVCMRHPWFDGPTLNA